MDTNDERSIALDTETTGLRHVDGDRIIEIGAVEIIGNMTTGKNFHAYMNPGRRRVHPEAYAIHNISDEFLADQPPISSCIPEFLDFIGDSKLVIHNAPFDMGFLNNEFDLLKRPRIKNEVVDTLRVAQNLFPTGRNSLDALCNRYGIDSSGRNYHGALIDSELLALVYIKMMELDKLDLGDRLVNRDQTGGSAPKLSIASASRPARDIRPSLIPSDEEQAAHSAFLQGKIKNPIWAKF